MTLIWHDEWGNAFPDPIQKLMSKLKKLDEIDELQMQLKYSEQAWERLRTAGFTRDRKEVA